MFICTDEKYLKLFIVPVDGIYIFCKVLYQLLKQTIQLFQNIMEMCTCFKYSITLIIYLLDTIGKNQVFFKEQI